MLAIEIIAGIVIFILAIYFGFLGFLFEIIFAILGGGSSGGNSSSGFSGGGSSDDF